MLVCKYLLSVLLGVSSVAHAQSTGGASSGASSFDFDIVRSGRDTSATSNVFVKIRIEAVKHMIELRSALQEAATAAFGRGDSVSGRWYLREDDRYALMSYKKTINGTVIPDFFREPPPAFNVVPVTRQSIRFFAFGDWSYYNKEDQQSVSAAVRAAHKKTPFIFGMTTGDNFYDDGIDSPVSPRWDTEYESQYGVMNVPIYAILGNHDHYSPYSVISEIIRTQHSKTWRMPASYYTFTAGSAQFFVVDSENFTKWQALWLDEQLGKSRSAWKIVVSHHDIYSNRAHGNSPLAASIIPMLKKHNVQVYLNGHYHTLQHHQVGGIDYITSGAGGRALYDLNEKDSVKYLDRKKFAARSNGFAHIEVTASLFTLRFIDQNGSEIYKYQRKRTGATSSSPASAVKLLLQSPTDSPRFFSKH